MIEIGNKPWRVSASTNPTRLAGALAKSARERNNVTLRAMGAGAVNQAVKSIAIACDYLHQDGAGDSLIAVPEFTDVEVDGRTVSAILLIVHVVNVKA